MALGKMFERATEDSSSQHFFLVTRRNEETTHERFVKNFGGPDCAAMLRARTKGGYEVSPNATLKTCERSINNACKKKQSRGQKKVESTKVVLDITERIWEI